MKVIPLSWDEILNSFENLSSGLLFQRTCGWFLHSLDDHCNCIKSRVRDLRIFRIEATSFNAWSYSFWHFQRFFSEVAIPKQIPLSHFHSPLNMHSSLKASLPFQISLQPPFFFGIVNSSTTWAWNSLQALQGKRGKKSLSYVCLEPGISHGKCCYYS